LSVAHLDHGVRGEAARADAAFVAELAGSLGLPFDLGVWRPLRAGHFESDARRARYTWLTEIARARGASAVAVGHTRDDQAETILHHIVRGTGLSGLAGIPSRRVLAPDPEITLVRPLLRTSRRAIRVYLAALEQPFCADQSNLDLARTRARIRHDLLPKLALECNPNVVGALVRLGALTASSLRAIEVNLQPLVRDAVLAVTPERVILNRRSLCMVPRFLRAEALRRVWQHVGWPAASMSARRWHRLAALWDQDDRARVMVGAGVEASVDGSLVVLSRLPGGESTAVVSVLSQGAIPLLMARSTSVPWADCRIEAEIAPDRESVHDELVDLDRVSGSLIVRAPVAGDRFEPLGMDGKSMALADFFRGRRVPRTGRMVTPLVCDQVGIVWVAGHRIADRVKQTEQTRRVLGLRLLRSPLPVNEISPGIHHQTPDWAPPP
jgi:tRNA(Ile)-lysidine synthase